MVWFGNDPEFSILKLSEWASSFHLLFYVVVKSLAKEVSSLGALKKGMKGLFNLT